MYVIATFEQSIFLELALTALEQKGISKEKLLAVPIDKRTEPRQIFNTIHRADGFSLLDTAAILATIFMVLGAIYGFELKWGPIIWGLIGAASGMLLGLLLKLLIIKKQNFMTKNITLEVVLMIRCEENQWETVEKILWENTALGVSRIKGVSER
jgi:hypothetical protein